MSFNLDRSVTTTKHFLPYLNLNNLYTIQYYITVSLFRQLFKYWCHHSFISRKTTYTNFNFTYRQIPLLLSPPVQKLALLKTTYTKKLSVYPYKRLPGKKYLYKKLCLQNIYVPKKIFTKTYHYKRFKNISVQIYTSSNIISTLHLHHLYRL